MYNRIKIIAILLLSVVALNTSWTDPYTLADCLNEALQKNPSILQAQQDIIRAGGAVISAKANFYPQISASAGESLQNNDVFRQQEPGNPGFAGTGWSVSVGLNQQLYNGGITRNNVAISKIQEQISLLQMQLTVNNVIYQTRTNFYNVLLNHADIALRQQNIDLLKREVERQKSLFDVGHSTKFNIIRTEVRLANELPGLEEAKANYKLALYDLMNTMGRPASGVDQAMDFDVTGDFDVTPYPDDVKALVDEALARSPQLSQLEKQLDVGQRNLDIIKASHIPQVSAFAGTNQSQDTSQGTFYFDNRNSSVFGLSASWNIFDGFASKGNAIQAEASIRQTMIQRDTAARQVEYDIRKALLNLRQAENSINAQKGNVDNAKKSVDLARSSVEAGLGTQFDILQATVDLSSAENIALRSRYQYNVAIADLERILFRRIGDNPDIPYGPLPNPTSPSSQPPVGQPQPALPAKPVTP